MKSSLITLLTLSLAPAGAVYRTALPGYEYSFPRDHFNHPEFQTEWWYYTGNVNSTDGRRFGFELTFFRHGVDRNPSHNSTWDLHDVWMAHLALSDVNGKRFIHTERLNRAGAGTAGASEQERRVWNGNWQAQWQPGERKQDLRALTEEFVLDLHLESAKAPVIHGSTGVSQKAAGAGQASHYISLTRLLTHGTIRMGGTSYSVEGLAWMDHEFFTHQLAPNQTGWDWFSLQLADNSELMLYRLRRKDGSVDPFSGGTYVDQQGGAHPLANSAFVLSPEGTWRSATSGGNYPIRWKISVPSLRTTLQIVTPLANQELVNTKGFNGAYWEGAIDATGTKDGKPMSATGYLEMTGYAAPLRMGN